MRELYCRREPGRGDGTKLLLSQEGEGEMRQLVAGSASLPGHLHIPARWDVCHATCGAWLSQLSRCTTRSRAATAFKLSR